MPGYPGEHYWQKPRIIYGVIPLIVGVFGTCVSGWLAARNSGRGSSGGIQPNADIVYSIGKSFGLTGLGIIIVFLLFCVKDLVTSRSR